MARVGHVLAVVGVGLCGGDVRFDPVPGTELVRTLEFEGETAFEGWSVVWNGREAPAEALPELWIEGREEARAVVRERVLACGDGRVSALERSFGALTARDVLEVSLAGVALEERDAQGRCALEDCTVRFEHGEVRLIDGDAPAELLAALELDLDCTALLEGGRDGAGAWEAPAAALVPTGLPGGIVFEFDGVPVEERVTIEAWAENLQGVWRVRRLETREDGALAAFALEGELSTWSERETDLDDVPIVDGDALETTRTSWEATGELVWDVARRTLRSLEVEARASTTVLTVRVLEGIENEPTYEQTLRLGGTSKLSVRVEVQ
ncbi:MAG TPA: hypothetical protein VMT18_16275 [Planctomycetota bacterium]|nr:hypothetical protein [Planctomycetota bacterium]